MMTMVPIAAPARGAGTGSADRTGPVRSTDANPTAFDDLVAGAVTAHGSEPSARPGAPHTPQSPEGTGRDRVGEADGGHAARPGRDTDHPRTHDHRTHDHRTHDREGDAALGVDAAVPALVPATALAAALAAGPAVLAADRPAPSGASAPGGHRAAVAGVERAGGNGSAAAAATAASAEHAARGATRLPGVAPGPGDGAGRPAGDGRDDGYGPTGAHADRHVTRPVGGDPRTTTGPSAIATTGSLPAGAPETAGPAATRIPGLAHGVSAGPHAAAAHAHPNAAAAAVPSPLGGGAHPHPATPGGMPSAGSAQPIDHTSDSSASATAASFSAVPAHGHAAPVAPAPAPATATPTTATAPAAHSTSAMMQPELAGSLAQLRGAVDGTYQLRVSVHPAELGAVSVTATMQHGALTVVLSPDPTAHAAVAGALSQLRQHLTDAGFAGVDIGLGAQQQDRGNPQPERRGVAVDRPRSEVIDPLAAPAGPTATSPLRPGGGALALDRWL